MARRKTKRTRRRKSFKILTALESLTYLEIIMRGTTGTGTVGFISGATDLGYSKNATVGDGAMNIWSTTGSQLVGTSEISLGDLVSNPSIATEQMVGNLQSNLVPMGIAALTTSITFNVGKRLLRKPINAVNNNIMKPILGAGIRL